MNTSNNTIQGLLKAKFESLKEWLIRYSKIVMPVVLAVCILITVVTAVTANKRKIEQEETVVATEEVDVSGTMIAVPEVPLEQDTVPGLNEFIQTYYTAIVEGDTEVLSKSVDYMDATELLRAVEMSKYIESYPTVEVYIKKGPREGTYLAYVYGEMKFYDYDRPVPGLSVFYICTNENGDFYINEDGEEDDNELYYIREVNLQDDAIDLNNRAAAAYNDMVAEDGELAAFIVDLKEEIEKNVGEALARKEGSDQTGEESEETSEESAETAQEPESPSMVVTKVKATDVVNIRTSDSETADKIGKAAVGDEFTLLEEKGNGWSKIEYDGAEAYIKSDYLEPSETETALAQENEPEEEESQQEEVDTNSNSNNSAPAASTETVTVKETVRIRKGASETSEKLATAYKGEKLKVLMKQADGWTRIEYNGQKAYVKSEFVE